MKFIIKNAGDIRERLLPAQCPEQIIFDRRNDGFYDMTIKVYAIDPNDKSKTKIVYEKCIVELPNWINGIPIAAKKQDDGVLCRIEIPKGIEE